LADLMLVPSEMESFGLAALEGMACEVPAVATTVVVFPKSLSTAGAGFLRRWAM